jgi:uncharacterized protein YyaL (SSP411 family)
METAKHANRLAREKSPYLLQHAHNPVDWFAWNDGAFAKARAEKKPILLSIGYSTCHWCHVMERESFEDEAVGKFLNEHFVSIKVDREERPDVDKIYMTFVQSTTGSGGWPLNVFLTPDLKPFFGGTYFPPDTRHGRPGFLQLLEQVAGVWRERQDEVAASAEALHARLETATTHLAPPDLVLTPDTLRRAALLFKETYDPENGGFGRAPKFPQPAIPALLLRHARRFGDSEAQQMVLRTCEHMAAGGIHDQLGGGFARYSVDAGWLVPHFEKMLYDNAQLAQLYLDAHLIHSSEGRVPRVPNSTENLGLAELVPPDESHFAATVRDILDYVLRDMTHPGGGFFSAEDADSEGHEGKFYCWTHDELAKLLTPEEFNVAARYFGVTKAGNFVDHSHPSPLPGQNVLSIADPNLPAADAPLLASARAKMLAVRAGRVRPHLDDKILASWNGLMLGAFARAGIVLGEEKYLVAAEKNLAFIKEKLWVDRHKSESPALTLTLSPGEREQQLSASSLRGADQAADHRGLAKERGTFPPLPGGEGRGEGKNTGTLFHRWRDGERDNVQLLEGYAFLLDGVVQLYEATLAPAHLDFANSLAEGMLAKFYDPADGGFWQSPADTKDLILRVKDDYDGAEPSGNSVAVLALLKLAAITGRAEFKDAAEATLRLFAQRLDNSPYALAFMLAAVDFHLDEPRRVVIAGDAGSAKAKALLRAAHSVYQPDKVVLGNTGAVEEFARTLPAKDGAVAYVCTGTACQPPTGDPAKLKGLLG